VKSIEQKTQVFCQIDVQEFRLRMGTRALLLHPLGLSTGEDNSGPRNHEGSSGPHNYEDLFRESLASGLESLPGYVEGAWPRGVTAHEKRIKESFEVCISLKNNKRLCGLSFLLCSVGSVVESAKSKSDFLFLCRSGSGSGSSFFCSGSFCSRGSFLAGTFRWDLL
jgi:hypothetical protein